MKTHTTRLTVNRLLASLLVALLIGRHTAHAGPVTEHPRLLFHSSQLDDLRSRMNASNPIWVSFSQIIDSMMADWKRGRTPEGYLIDVDGTVLPDSYLSAMPEDDAGIAEATSHPSETYAMMFALMSLLDTNSVHQAEYIAASKECLFKVIDIAVLGHDPNNPGLAFRQKSFAQSQRSFYAESFPYTVDWLLAHGANTFTALEKAKLRKCFLMWAQDCRDHVYFAPTNPEHFNNTTNLLRLTDPGQAITREQIRLALNNHYGNHLRAIGMNAMSFDPADDVPNPGIGDNAPAGALTGYLPGPNGEWVYQNTGELRDAVGVWLYLTDYALRHDGGGGISQEGAMYASNGLGPVAQMMAALHMAGQDDPSVWGPQVSLVDHPAWWKVARGCLAQVPPAPRAAKINMEYMGSTFEPVPWGDMQNYYLDDVFAKVMGPLALVDIDLHGPNAPFAQQARWFLANLPEGGPSELAARVRHLESNARWRDAIYYFLLFDPKAAPATDPRLTEPPGYSTRFDPAGTMGSIFSRTAGTSPAAFFDWRLGWNRIDHQGGDGNSVELWYNGVWITRRWAGYGARTLCSDYQNAFAFGGWAATDPNYGNLVTLPWANGGQFPYGPNGDPVILARSVAGEYVFTTGDATPLYNSFTHTELRKVTQAVRSTLWVKPGLLFVLDRAATVGTSSKVQWFNMQSPPVISGNTASLTVVDQWKTSEWNNQLQQSEYTYHSIPKADVRITSVFPATTLSINTDQPQEAGSNIETAVGEEQTARLKIQASGDPQATHMLAVLDTVLPGASHPVVTGLVSSSGTSFQGAIAGNIGALFKANPGDIFTSVSYNIPATVTQQYISGLTPNAGFDVTMLAAPGGGVTVTITPDGSTSASDAGGVLVIGTGTSTVAVTALDPVGIEGGNDNASFSISRSGDLSQNLVVNYTVTGTATPGSDFQSLTGQVTIPIGSASVTVPVVILDDSAYEPAESVIITLATGNGYQIDHSADSAEVSILSDDAPPGGTIQFASSTYSAAEASVATITVKRVGGFAGSVSALVSLSPAGGESFDFVPESKAVSWTDGDSSDKSVSFTMQDDSTYRPNETALLSLGSIAGVAVVGNPATATLNISDNDPAPPGQITFDAPAYSIAENGGQLTIPVERLNGSGGAVTANIAIGNATATLGADYTLSATQLSWASGDTDTKYLTFSVMQDSIYEGASEFVSLVLSIASGTATTGSVATAVVTIIDDDPEPQQYDVGEGFPYPTIGSIPWKSLGGGAEVRIHYRPTAYHEKILISTRGTAGNPIKVTGIAGPNGEKPMISGASATSSASLGYESWSYTPVMGVVAVARGANTPTGGKAGYVEISGLDVGGMTDSTFTDSSGTTQSYFSSGGAIYLRGAEHVTIRDCVVHHSPNGLVAEDYSTEPEINRDLLIERCWFHDNSKAGAWSGQNLQMEAVGVTVQFCRFDANLNRNNTANVRDRSAGATYRYNTVDGGSYLLELIEASGAPVIVGGDASYATTYVYGNTLVNRDQDGSSMVRFGAAYGSGTPYVRPLLHFYDNTVALATSSTSHGVFSLSGVASTVEARNNIFQANASQFQLLTSSGTVNLGKNWMKTGWSGGWNGTVNGGTNVIAGTDPGFVNLADGDYHLAVNSPSRNSAGALAAGVPSVSFQYKDPAQGELRFDATDLGAYGFASPPSIVTGAATALGQGSATLNGSINPKGLAGSVWFEWGITAAYGHTTPAQSIAAGNQSVIFSAQVGGLPGHSTIHFRAAGSNVVQTVKGADAQYTTGDASPIAIADTFNMEPNTLLTVPASLLTANDTDADQDTLTVTGVANPMPAGASVLFANGVAAYQAPANFIGTGSFTYTIADGFGGTASGQVTVAVQTSANALPQLSGIQAGANGIITFVFAGPPSTGYQVETSTDLHTWTPMGSVQTGADGFFGIDESPANSARFFRVKNP